MTSRRAALRVALVHWTMPPTTGGVESHLADLARLLAQRGVAVTVLTGEPSPTPIEHVEILSETTLDLTRVRADARLRTPAAEQTYTEVLRRTLAARHVDVVHGHNLHHFSPGPALALETLRGDLGFAMFHTFHETWPDILAERAVYRDWDSNYAVSTHVQGECELRLGYSPDLFCLGVDTELFRVSRPRYGADELPVILHPARLLPWKGVHVSVAALALLRDAGVRAMLVVTDTQRIADWDQELDDYRRSVVATAVRLGVADQIQFRDTRFSDMPALYAAADVVVYPTVGDEPFGLVPLEAMSCGRPIVATRSGGITETVIDGLTGYLVDRGAADQLAARLLTLLGDPPLRARMGAAGRAHVRRSFSASNYVERLLRDYETARSSTAAVP